MNTYAVVVSTQLNSCLIEIYQFFAEQCHREVSCTPLAYAEKSCEDLWDHLSVHNYNGVVVSSALSQSLFEYADLHGDLALSSGLSHTLVFQDGVSFAENTESLGFWADLKKHEASLPEEPHPLIIGSGRTALSMIVAFAKEGISVSVANRSYAKAKHLMNICDQNAISSYVDIVPWENLQDVSANMIVNSTKLSMQDVLLPPALLERVRFWYEISVYSLDNLYLLREYALRHHIVFTDGWGLLVESAAESFLLWEGQLPETALLFSDQKRFLIFPE